MSEDHSKVYTPLVNAPKQDRYKQVLEQLEGRLDSNSHPLSNSSNLVAVLKQEFNWWWIGYYWLNKTKDSEYLALGQFQGPPACTKLFKGIGVCGTSWQKKESIIVQDVQKFPGHIACSSASKSQIVIPIFSGDEVIGVLDIDSARHSQFDQVDDKWLQILLKKVSEIGAFEWFKKTMGSL